MAHKAGTQPSD